METEKLELKSPLMQLRRIEDYLGSNLDDGALYSTIRHDLVDMLHRILDDLNSVYFLPSLKIR